MNRVLNTIDNFKDKVENVKETKKLKTTKFISKEIKVPNHILFEYNYTTKKLVRAKFKPSDLVIDFTQPNPARHFLDKFNKVIIQENCIYFQALNESNAIKKLKRDYNVNYKQDEKQ